MARKLYSAFVSSVYIRLKEVRDKTIECLLDNFIYPVCTEHCLTAVKSDFRDIQALIDISDFVILLLGKDYGSVTAGTLDETDGMSFAQKEYEYAMEKGKHIIALVCEDLEENELGARGPSPREVDRQKAFVAGIPNVIRADGDASVKAVITRFLASADKNAFDGWERGISDQARAKAQAGFEYTHRAFDLRGRWYHAHISSDPNYLRIGETDISQDFNESRYLRLRLNSINYNAMLENGLIKEDLTKSSRWSGNYYMNEEGEIQGVYHSKRSFSGDYNGESIGRGDVYGIHNFRIDAIPPERETTRFGGDFNDAAPSPKIGTVFFYRDKGERDSFVLENCVQALRSRKETGDGLQ